MTMSGLSQGFIEASHYYSRYDSYNNIYHKITKITIHHVAGVGTAEQIAANFTGARVASANYVIGNDGKIMCCVPEEYRAATSSSVWNDYQAITIEVSNSEAAADYPVSTAAYQALIDLCFDICLRHKITPRYDGTINASFTEHRMYAATACPGDYLHSRIPAIVAEVKNRLEEYKMESENAKKIEALEKTIKTMQNKNDELQKQCDRLFALVKILDKDYEEHTKPIYKNKADCPAWAKDDINVLMHNNILRGNEKGEINLSVDGLRNATLLSRVFQLLRGSK